MESPFNRSSLTPRSPPTTKPAAESVPPPEVVSTTEIQKWLSNIENCLSDVCTIAESGKLNTEQKLKISTNCRGILGGVSQLVVKYQNVKQQLLLAHSQIDLLDREMAISVQLDELKTSIKSLPEHSIPTTSFADMVKNGNNSVIRPPTSSSIAIYPADKGTTSEETKKIVQNIIKPDKLKLQVSGFRKIRNGGVIISTDRKDDLEKLKKSEQLSTSGLKIEEPTKRRPRIVLIGVPSDISDKVTIDCLYEQNIADKYSTLSRDKFLSSVRLSHKSGKKDTPYCNFILEVTAEVRKLLIAQTRVYINWNSCPVKDFTLVTRCYKCHQYGHSAKYCRDTEPTCGHCGGVGHSSKDCISRDQQAKCATCMRFKKPSSHKTGDEQCPARKIAEDRYLRSTDYGNA